MNLFRPAPALLAAAWLAGCASPAGIAPSHEPLRLAAPADAAGWPDPARDGTAWADWHDARLDALIAGALRDQPSLKIVQLRVQQAGRAVVAADAARSPQVNASVDLSDQRFTKNGMFPPPLGGALLWNNSAQFGASWEWDLFGRQRAALAAALGTQRAAATEAQAAGMLLAANIASGWVGLARALELRSVAQSALTEREQVLAIVRDRVGAGLDTTVDLRQAEGAVAQTRLDTTAADQQIARARHALAELSGQPPQALDDLAPALAPLHPRALPAGLPLALIGRRADIVAERWRVEAAAREVDVARAQFYPNINLVAFAGLSSLGLSDFLKAGSQTYGIGPALSLPIFDGGRLRANLGAKADAADIAVESYNATLLRALREVADEVSDLRSIEAQQHEQAAALAAAESAFQLATERYRAGLGNFLVVLTAESSVLAQRRGHAELKARHLLAEVALSRALGGGVSADAPTNNTIAQRVPQ
jgi:NodT family efflux transporter outer membrane factor (OMF) lipoprotein